MHHQPAAPDQMIDLAQGYDVGLCLEQPTVLSRDLCLTNKAFTYMLAGLAIVFTNTKGQRELARSLGDGTVIYSAGDITALASGLNRWANDKEALLHAKQASWKAAQERWHWGHPLEKAALVAAVEKAMR
jgi:hypothetical protein